MKTEEIEGFFSRAKDSEELPRYNYVPIGDNEVLVTAPSKRKGKRFIKHFLPNVKFTIFKNDGPHHFIFEYANQFSVTNGGFPEDGWDEEEVAILQWNFPRRKYQELWTKYGYDK